MLVTRLPHPARILAAVASLLLASAGFAQTKALPDREAVLAAYRSGDYQTAARLATQGSEAQPWDEQWAQIKAESLMATGQYFDAFEFLLEAATRQSYSIRLRLLLREAAFHSGEPAVAEQQLLTIRQLISSRSRSRYGNPDAVVAFGEAALLFGVEPRIVLDNFFKRAQQEENAPASAFIAAAELAMGKSDFALAAKTFREGLATHPDDPDLLSGLARAFADSDRGQTAQHADQALAINPSHVPTLLLLADLMVDAESYDEAAAKLDDAFEVNPLHPRALALKAAIAYIREDQAGGDALRDEALSTWPANPEVDYAIGQKLSRKYRFTDGAAAQRRALSFDPEYTPARIQLAQDLLRLGRDDEGWRHADQAREADPYNIEAYNLVSLHDKLDQFTTLHSPRFQARMTHQEAGIYGPRVLELLERAHTVLAERYGWNATEKTTVEIYPSPSDFAVRTFGMPGNPGFLGVCFGPVFTINSPSSQRANWESVLYHEFCHTVTLDLTRNRIPRWLTEGLSVYEEEQANPAWGQRMTADYSRRILEGRMQSIGQMSAAFLQAEDGDDVQFAYYQSYLVVRFLSETFGAEAIRSTLADLGQGVSINQALADRLAPIEDLDRDFVAYAKAEAEQLGGAYSLKKPEAGLVPQALALLNLKPDYYKAFEDAQTLVDKKSWPEAKAALAELIQKAGYLPRDENAHILLAAACRELGQTAEEKAVLETIVSREADKLDPITRLLAIAHQESDWTAVQRWSAAWLAINPMSETPWRSLLAAETRNENRSAAIAAANALLQLKPADQASLHYQLAALHRPDDLNRAHRHVLQALENAPRYRDAYALLLKINAERSPAKIDFSLE